MASDLIQSLDHLVVLTHDLDAAEKSYAHILGLAPSWRSRAAGGKTLAFTTGNTTLELLAPDPSDTRHAALAATLASEGEGLASLCFRTTNVERMHRRLQRLGLDPDTISAASSKDEMTGAELNWRRTRSNRDACHGIRAFFLELLGERPQSQRAGEGAVAGLDHVVVATQQPDRAAALFGARFGLDMRLDITSQDWGSRLMFFRCGDVIIEIAHGLRQVDLAPRDQLYGLTWRSDDLDAAHKRIEDAGVNVSPIRIGRKKNTRVFTVKSGTCNVPTLFIGV